MDRSRVNRRTTPPQQNTASPARRQISSLRLKATAVRSTISKLLWWPTIISLWGVKYPTRSVMTPTKMRLIPPHRPARNQNPRQHLRQPRLFIGSTAYSKSSSCNIRKQVQKTEIYEKQYQKKWLRHVQRMETNKIPKQALQCKPKGRRNIGQPRKRRRDQLHLEDQGTGNMPNPSWTWWCWCNYLFLKIWLMHYIYINTTLFTIYTHTCLRPQRGHGEGVLINFVSRVKKIHVQM